MYSFFDYQPQMAYGGSPQGQDQQQQIMQVVQAYAQATGTPVEQIVAQLQKMPPKQQQVTLQKMVASLQGADNQSDMQQPQQMGYAAEGIEVEDGPGDGVFSTLANAAGSAWNKAKQVAGNTYRGFASGDFPTIAGTVLGGPFGAIVGSNLPSNVKGLTRMAAASMGYPNNNPFLQKSDFTKAELKAMRDAAMRAKKRTGASHGGTRYSDYGKGYGNPWGDKMRLLTDPKRTAQTSIGRFTYDVNGNDVNLSDQYNFYGKDQGSLPARFINSLDKLLPANDPRRNINFNITSEDVKKNGGLYKAYEGVSVVDYLAGRGQDFSKEARKKLAAEKGIKDYDFSTDKNLELLRLLQSEESGTPAAPVRKITKTGKAPEVSPASGKFGSYNPANNKIQYSPDGNRAVVSESKKPTVTSTMTEGQRTAAMVKAGDMYTPSWKKTPAKLPSKTAAKKEAVEKSKNIYTTPYGANYVDLQQAFGLDPFSKEGILKAQELTRSNPKTRIVCTAAGCSEIAVDAAEAFGYDFNRGNAWDLANQNKVLAQNPIYASQIGKGILPDPRSYTSPASVYQRPGSIIGLNRINNRAAGDRNDSYDYADQTVYPGSRGYEHVGYMIDQNTMLHGTGAGKDHPAYYVIDPSVANGVQLPGYGSYQPVEAIAPSTKKGFWSSAKNLFGFQNGGYYTNKEGKKVKAKGTGTNQGNVYFKQGGMPCYECGGAYAYGGDIIPNYMKETSPMYNFGGYFPQGPRFNDGGQTMDNTMMGMINVFQHGGQHGGIVVGETYDATPELLQKLSEGGYTYELV